MMPAAMLGLMVAAMAGAGQAASAENPADWALPDRVDPHAVPVDYRVMEPARYRLPVSDSLRAATWDMLERKPAAPVTVRLACAVWRHGRATDCVDAALVPPGQTVIDWAQLRDRDAAAERSVDMARIQLRRVAAERIGAALLPKGTADAPLATIGFFEEVISPADARAPFAAKDATAIVRAVMAAPVDIALVGDLYPAIAIRRRVTARVAMTCRITDALRLLCRDPGTIDYAPGSDPGTPSRIPGALRNATYQFASTLRFLPKTGDGEDVAGRAYRVSIKWQMPGE